MEAILLGPAAYQLVAARARGASRNGPFA